MSAAGGEKRKPLEKMGLSWSLSLKFSILFFPPRGAHRPSCTMGAVAETNALRKICVKVKHLQD